LILKKLILTREYKNYGMFTCPYCKSVSSELDYQCNNPWCETKLKCPACYEDVLPHRSMKKEEEKS